MNNKLNRLYTYVWNKKISIDYNIQWIMYTYKIYVNIIYFMLYYILLYLYDINHTVHLYIDLYIHASLPTLSNQ